MIHLTLSLINDSPTLCGKLPGEVMTQLGHGFKRQLGVDCPVCLSTYNSASAAFDAFAHLPLSPEELSLREEEEDDSLR